MLRYHGETGDFVDAFVSKGSGGLDGPGGLAFAHNGDLYVASVLTDEVLRYDAQTGAFLNAFVTANSGGLDAPHSITVGDEGELYVGSYHTDAILLYDGLTGAFVKEFVVSGSGGLDAPQDHVFGPDGFLYVSSLFTDEVLRYNSTTGEYVDTYIQAGYGSLDGPRGMFFDQHGNFYVSSFDNDAILKYGNPAVSSDREKENIIEESQLVLLGSFPNPFSDRATIEYDLENPGQTRIILYDSLGRMQRVLWDGWQLRGRHQVVLESDGLAAGAYYYQIQNQVEIQTGKVLIVR